ncbi:MAG: putative LPS assembly protein LptD [Calditrichia bacterium]
MKTYSLFLLFLLFTPALAQLQDEAVRSDSSSIVQRPDSSNSLVQDSMQTLQAPPGSGIDGPIRYSADLITFHVAEKTTEMEGNVKIVYGELTLDAAKVQINWTENRMIAEAVADSVDSLGNPVLRGRPTLLEEGEPPIVGLKLEYDFKSQRGKVLEGRTNMDPGYYRGSDIRKVGDETLLIQDAYFTSCDHDHPHFYFRSQKLRMRVRKTAVAKPVVLYIADVPILAAPFAFFSLKRGRRSGIILPTYGENSRAGRSLQRFGFYWAASDYWDATLLANFYEKTGVAYTGSVQYKTRYALNGSINADYAPKDVLTGAKRERWAMRFSHNQTLGENTTINGSGSFVSDKDFTRDLSEDINARLEQQLRTNVTLRRKLPGQRQLSVNASRDENLQTGQVGYTLPDVIYSQTSRSIIPSSGLEKSWYNNIQYGYGSKIRSRFDKTPDQINDSTDVTETFLETTSAGWEHNATLSFTGLKVLKHFRINPSVRAVELWVPRSLEYSLDDSTQTLISKEVDGFRARHTYSASATMNTTLYGLWEIPFSPMKVIRHKIDPSIGFSYTPDFGDESYDYFQSFTTSSGDVLYGDRFGRDINPFSTVGRGESRSLTMSVNNLFQGKILRGEEEKKIDLIRVNMNTAYNFAADSIRLNNLSTSVTAKPVQNFNFSFNSTHSFYRTRSGTTSRIDEFVWDDGFKLPTLLNWRVSANTNFSLRPPAPDAEQEQIADSLDQQLPGVTTNQPGRQGIGNFGNDFGEYRDLNIPWSLNAALNFSYNKDVINDNTTWNFDTFLNGRIQLTKKWQINYTAQVDLREQAIDRQEFRISRDLHCWTMNFRWAPNPSFSSYRLEIRVNASALQDLKVTKTSSGSRPF